MIQFSIPDAAVGPIAAAVVAAVIAFLGLVISKESKTSEFRQAWIDDLRSDLASLITNAMSIRGLINESYESRADGLKAVVDYVHDFNMASTAIRLRLNPLERRCVVVLELMSELDKLVVAQPIDRDAVLAVEKNLLDASRSLLKIEWARVRRGEAVFVASKWLFGVTFVALLGLLVFAWWTGPVAKALPSNSTVQPAAIIGVIPPVDGKK